MRLTSLVLTGCLLAGGSLAAQQPPPRDPRPVAPEAAPKPTAKEPVSFEAMIAKLEAAAALTPDKPDGYAKLAAFYEEKVRRDTELLQTEKWTYVLQGISAADRVLTIDPTHVEGLIFKGILLRHQAQLVPDPGQRQALIDEADMLRAQALELRKASGVPVPRPAVAGAEGAAGAPCRLGTPDGTAPVRVGGNISAPTKTLNVSPVYPVDALQARVAGVVILEVLIAPTGEVSQACVLRSIPLLDEAAVDAVTQWQFEPTELNGTPVPVVMTVTVNFTLQ